MRRLALSLALASVLTAPVAFAQEDLSKINGSVTARSGQEYGDVSTVNGSVRIESDARVGETSTVNGSVTVQDGAEAESLTTVNGALRIGERVQVTGEAMTVNGALSAGTGTRVEQDLGTVNGAITLHGVEVGGTVRTVSGDITLGEDTVVAGDVLVEKPGMSLFGFGSRGKPPRIVIGPGATVRGTLRFEREVELFVSDRATVGAIEGAEPKTFSGESP